jgi:uncharacterized protein YybS (DUF2232 family)
LAWSLRRSAAAGKSPAAAGGAGLTILSLSWLAFWLCYGLLSSSNPYSSLLTGFHQALHEAVQAYRASRTDMPAEILYSLELTAAWLRRHLADLLPGLLISGLVGNVWLNMLVSNWLLGKIQPNKAPWLPYRCWRLPDQFVWLLIVGAGLAAVSAGHARTVGFTSVAVAALVYFFQGTAVFAHLLHRWKVPALGRFFLYFIVAAQSYGMMLLAVIGVADIWADFRKLAQDEQDNGSSSS